VPDDVLRGPIQALRGLAANPLDLLGDALIELTKRSEACSGDASSTDIQCSDTSRHLPTCEA
jgi:hypothetical protein